MAAFQNCRNRFPISVRRSLTSINSALALLSGPIVAILLAVGADPDIRDDTGFTVEDWAKIEMYEGLPPVLDMLRRHRARSS